MNQKQLFILVMKLFTFLLFLLCFFIPHKIFIHPVAKSITNLSFIYHERNSMLLFITLVIILCTIIFSIFINWKKIKILFLILSFIMIIISSYYLYDGIFVKETYIISASIMGISSIIMMLLSIWSFFLYFYDEKIFDYFYNKKSIKYLIPKTVITFFILLIIIGFLMPIVKIDYSFFIKEDIQRANILLVNNGIINFVILLVYFIVLLFIPNHLKNKIMSKLITFLIILVSCCNFIYTSVYLENAWFSGGKTFGIGIPYMIVLSIISFFIFVKNEWLLKFNTENCN